MDDGFNRTRGLTLLCALAVFQAMLRIAIPLSIMTGAMVDEDLGISGAIVDVVNVMFLVLGVAGIIAAAGIWTGRGWGIDWTIGLSLITIAFDLLAVLTVQPSAAMGLVLPAAFIVYLMPMRGRCRGFVGHEGTGRVRD